MQRRTLISGILLLTALALGFFGRSALRGSLLDDASIDTAIHMRADSNSDGALSTRELRVALIDIVRGVLLQRDGYDINGDGTVTRADLTSAKQSLRRLLTASCGNGAVEAGEQCDDGNTAGSDGCSAVCRIESGFQCSGTPSACFPESCAARSYTLGDILYRDTSSDPTAPLRKANAIWKYVDRDADTLTLMSGDSVVRVQLGSLMLPATDFRILSRLPSAAQSEMNGMAPAVVTKQDERILGIDRDRDEMYVFSSAVSSYDQANNVVYRFSASVFRLNYRTFEVLAEYPIPDSTPYPVFEASAYDEIHHAVVAVVHPYTQWEYTSVRGQPQAVPPPPIEVGTYIVSLPVPADANLPVQMGPWLRIGTDSNTSFTRLVLDPGSRSAFITRMDSAAPYAKYLERYSYTDGVLSLQQGTHLSYAPTRLWIETGRLFLGFQDPEPRVARWNMSEFLEDIVAPLSPMFGNGTIISDSGIAIAPYYDLSPDDYLLRSDLDRMQFTVEPGLAGDWSDNHAELPYDIVRTTTADGTDEFLVLSFTDRKVPPRYSYEPLNSVPTPRLIVRRLLIQCR